MILTSQRPLAILLATALTLALWSPTLSSPVQASQGGTPSQARTAPHFVFATASAAPVLM
ncbi:hypothetical protein [Novosphingobium sp. 9U]|uniref:hypothetical protein n=1 Tax=Novosphingobium sp. 9U TaxID=2653158 RepID=UPI0012F18875|nr:hypothetical protein [Novosphingobium sp. 9U]VWX53403.1 conserved hypothetical protein [Novosphingobium sp. 9U]